MISRWTDRYPIAAGVFFAAFTAINASSAVELYGRSKYEFAKNGVWAVVGAIVLVFHLKEYWTQKQR